MRTNNIPSVLTLSSLLLVALFAFSVLTPEPSDIQGYDGKKVPVFVESDASSALCTTHTIIVESHIYLGDLPRAPQEVSFAAPVVWGHFYRGPPPRS